MPKGKAIAKKPKAPSTAAGQALGYSIQFTRLVAMLLEASPGSSCSLEVLDDVAEKNSSGKDTLIQAKSSLTANPVADRALPLWKTISNWLRLAEEGIVDLRNSIFELYVSRPVSGDLIDAFDKARDEAEAAQAIAEARELLWGAAPEFPKKGTLPDSIAEFVNHVLGAKEELIFPLIANMRLRCGPGSAQADLEAIISKHPVSQSRVPDIADKMCGWVKHKVDGQLSKGIPAVVLKDEFQAEYTAYVRSVDRDIVLKSFARKPSEAEAIGGLPNVFVQQLEFIEIPYDEKLAAVSDWLRASWDRTIWSTSGDVHEASFDALNEALTKAWTNLRRATWLAMASRPPIERGQMLHAKCMLHRTKLQGMEVPDHFIPGCLHDLADDKAIGWHPDYKTLLSKPIKAA